MTERYENFLAGAWARTRGDQWLAHPAPAAPTSTCAEVPASGPAEVDAAVAAASEAQRAWAATDPVQRVEVLSRLLDEWARQAPGATLALGTQTGFPAGRLELAWTRAAAAASDLLAAWAPDLEALSPHPVVAALASWRAPLALPLGEVLAALAAGSAVVVAGHPAAPEGPAALARAALAAGLPPGVLGVVFGDQACATTLATHDAVERVVVEGRRATAAAVLREASAELRPVQQVSTHPSTLVLLAGADAGAATGLALRGLVAGGRGPAGLQRVVAHEEVYDAFLDQLVARARALGAGPGGDPGTDLGPLATRAARDRAEALVEQGQSEDRAERLLGGERPGLAGWYLAPTIFAEVTPVMRLAREQAGGPLLAVMPASSDEEALALAQQDRRGPLVLCAAGAEDARAAFARTEAPLTFWNHTPETSLEGASATRLLAAAGAARRLVLAPPEGQPGAPGP